MRKIFLSFLQQCRLIRPKRRTGSRAVAPVRQGPDEADHQSIRWEKIRMTEPIDLSGKSMSELLQMYNDKAEFMDRPKVKRFADRATAEKRVNHIIAAIGAVGSKSPPETSVPVMNVPPEKPDEGPDVLGETPAEARADLATIETANETSTQENEDMATRSKAKNTRAAKPKGKTVKPRAAKANGEMVRKDSYRDKLMKVFDANIGKQVPISKLLVAVYGESRKDYKGPLMMVMKGLKDVLVTNRTGKEIRKSRENKENYFGLHRKN